MHQGPRPTVAPIPAAQYVRMSTDLQQYSIDTANVQGHFVMQDFFDRRHRPPPTAILPDAGRVPHLTV